MTFTKETGLGLGLGLGSEIAVFVLSYKNNAKFSILINLVDGLCHSTDSSSVYIVTKTTLRRFAAYIWHPNIEKLGTFSKLEVKAKGCFLKQEFKCLETISGRK